MNKDTIINFEAMKKIAIDLLKNRKTINPMLITIKDNIIDNIIITSWKNNLEKKIATKALRATIIAERPDSYFLITESWIITKEDYDKLKLNPAEHPKRKEVLNVFHYCADMTKNIGFIFFHKGEDGEIIIDDETNDESKETKELMETFNFYLEEGGHEERLKRSGL